MKEKKGKLGANSGFKLVCVYPQNHIGILTSVEFTTALELGRQINIS